MKTLILIGLAANLALADTVELRTGEKTDGTFKRAGNGSVVIAVAGQDVTIPIEKVRAIYFGEITSPVSARRSPAAAADAVDALRALKSVTASGIAYRDYAPRVLDCKVRVDRYLASAGETKPLPKAIKSSMFWYEHASQMWNMWLDSSEEERNMMKSTLGHIDVQLKQAWQRASTELTEAEKLLNQQ